MIESHSPRDENCRCEYHQAKKLTAQMDAAIDEMQLAVGDDCFFVNQGLSISGSDGARIEVFMPRPEHILTGEDRIAFSFTWFEGELSLHDDIRQEVIRACRETAARATAMAGKLENEGGIFA